jgi:hypothetical protein
MFMFSESTEKHYVLKEVDNGNTPARDTGNAISQRQSSRGGFVALEAGSPEAGTRVKLYVYDIEPYEANQNDVLMLFKDGKLPPNAIVTPKGIKYTDLFVEKGTLLSNAMLDGWIIAGVTPQSGVGWKVKFVNGAIVVTFTKDVYNDETVTVTLQKIGSSETREIDITFSGERETLLDMILDKAGCNTGVALLALLALCPLTRRRK